MQSNRRIIVHSFEGFSDYRKMWTFQEQLQKELIENKLQGNYDPAGHLIFCEHPHVYTLGRFGDSNNMLLDHIKLQAAGAEFHHIDRGGDITYHGPGQLVGYPIFNLEAFGMGVKTYIHTMEEAIIRTLETLGIQSERLEGATGVWIDTSVPAKTRKICAIGVKVNRGVSMHGFALNINTDLSYFSHINPCGFTDKKVTSIEKEIGCKTSFQTISNILEIKMAYLFDFEVIKKTKT
jgi:lipoyl(octanoyl) transferase